MSSSTRYVQAINGPEELVKPSTLHMEVQVLTLVVPGSHNSSGMTMARSSSSSQTL